MAGPFSGLYEAVTVLDVSGGPRGRLQFGPRRFWLVSLRFGGALDLLLLRVKDRGGSLKADG